MITGLQIRAPTCSLRVDALTDGATRRLPTSCMWYCTIQLENRSIHSMIIEQNLNNTECSNWLKFSASQVRENRCIGA